MQGGIGKVYGTLNEARRVVVRTSSASQQVFQNNEPAVPLRTVSSNYSALTSTITLPLIKQYVLDCESFSFSMCNTPNSSSRSTLCEEY